MPTQTDPIAEGPRARSGSPSRHVGAGIAFALAFALAGCGGGAAPKFDTPYQAVFMANGQVFFGKLSSLGTDYPRLDDVFYVQQQVNPDTKQATNVLIRRGREWHAPSYMVLNARSVLLIEPVGTDSKVAQLIAEAQKAPAAKP